MTAAFERPIKRPPEQPPEQRPQPIAPLPKPVSFEQFIAWYPRIQNIDMSYVVE